MPMTTNRPVENRLLQGLSKIDYGRLEAQCDNVELTFGTVLCESGHPILHVYFPQTAFISQVVTLHGHPPLQVGLIGNEGMLGATLALGVNTAPMRAVVQGAGTCLRMSGLQLQIALRNSPLLLRRLNQYLYVQLMQLAQTAACTHFHEIEPRLARWLLMTHDRAHANHFHLTHVSLANMLGVRRSGVTLAAGALQQRGLIRYTRGEITIIDRKGLEAASCECYSDTHSLPL
ncbi:Crp/Fnr family transcriptional regulator [Pseudomonas sp. 6D_7.1_Bac1]|uniref:Crp/Fnr family transcriptional regulator n=1 Tax=Pseudomonas sp. 6D_7.1_Bac1 TaxID=2971615 RepID=UPI0021C7A3B8|nr:Crp/Fnr family transcriptional regulator [Pseudomonas sp. 6D_7.1_Bac1]MCU1748068.1 Crp/Fnr family transcriptional regulator [Pseudomonas sp. 6D_7.1_Bac1]